MSRRRSEFAQAFCGDDLYQWFCDQAYPLVEDTENSLGDLDCLTQPAHLVTLGALDRARLARLAEHKGKDANLILSRLIHDALVRAYDAYGLEFCSRAGLPPRLLQEHNPLMSRDLGLQPQAQGGA